MNVFTSLLIAIIELFSLTMAEWYPESPLILIHDESKNLKMFPQMVYESKNYKVYYAPETESTSVTYAYCPRSDGEDKLCNYPVHYVSTIANKSQWLVSCYVLVSPDVIMVIENNDEKICLHNGRMGTTYKFVYWLCKEEEVGVIREELSIYEMCYEQSSEQIIIGSYTIPTPKLLAEPLLAEEQSHSFFFQEPQHHLYNEHPEYVPRSVLPSELLPFAHQRRPLFNAKNIAPMHRFVITYWEQVMLNLKAKISKMRYEVHVTAGLIDVMKNKNENTTKYLSDKSGVTGAQIPKWWWVMINNKDATLGVVVMIYNKEYNKDENEGFFNKQHCNYGICDTANLRDIIYIDDIRYGYFIYCCHANVIFSAFQLHPPPYRNDILRFHDA